MLVPVVVAAVVLLAVGIALMEWNYRDRRLAIIAGPDGKPAAYELWWNLRGDLKLVDVATNSVAASTWDYYDDLQLVAMEWQSPGIATLTTREGIVFRVDLQSRAIAADRSGWRMPRQPRTSVGVPTTTLSPATRTVSP